MSRYTGPVCRICRREGMKLMLKGDRCFTDKCAFSRKPAAPGTQAGHRMRKLSDYGTQLREKQRIRKMYGMSEKQFRKYYKMAVRKPGKTGELFLQLLESRLDCVIYQLGYTDSRAQARQLVNHGHFQVNGKKVDIASYLLRPSDVITVKEKSRSIGVLKKRMEEADANACKPWLSIEPAAYKGTFVSVPERAQLPEDIQEHLIVEYYSR